MSPKVQDFASGLVKNVYGRIMPSKTESASEPAIPAASHSLDDLAKRIEQLPNREELVASFAVLQAELERQNLITRRYVVAAVTAQVALLSAVLAWMLG